jgi:anti-sigma-K factor RskA
MTNGTRSHEELEALIAADALGGLSEDDRAAMFDEMAEHGPACAECARLTAEYREVAGRMALLAEPVALSSDASGRLLERASAEAAPVTRTSVRRPSRIGDARRWIAAVAVAASVVAAGAIGYSIAPRPGSPRVVSFAAPAGQSLSVAYQPGNDRGVVVGSNVPSPPEGKVYELWFLPKGGSGMQPAGTFSPRGGKVHASVTVGSSFTTLAVSVEPRGGSRQPTSAPLYLARVPAGT